jgi:hypothetical protein
MSHLRFDRKPNPGNKTCRWLIVNPAGDEDTGTGQLGFIEYRPTWRRYVWGTLNNAIFDVECTKEIVDFLLAHKDDRQ